MFEKGKNTDIKSVDIDKKNLYKQYNNISITPAFIIMLNKYYEDKKIQDHLDYDENIKSYINKSFEYSIKKQYNNTIYNLYHSGKILINKQEYDLKSFFITSKDDKDFNLLCTDNRYSNKKVDYNKSVKLIDTSLFIDLINKNEIKNNTIIIDNADNLLDYVNNWDGLLHDKVSETDAIVNK